MYYQGKEYTNPTGEVILGFHTDGGVETEPVARIQGQ